MKFVDLIPLVAVKAPGVPNFIAEAALREAAIDFCVRTDAYQAPLEPLAVVPGISEYDITTATGTLLNHVVALYRKGDDGKYVPLKPKTLRYIYEYQGAGRANFYSQTDSDSLIVAPTPAERETLYLLYTVKPTATSTSIPDSIARENTEALVNGAAYRLQIQTRMPWSDPKSAAINQEMFLKSVSTVAKSVRSGYVGGEVKVQMRAFV